MSIKDKAARGVKWQALDIVGRQFITFVVFTTLSNMLDPSDFGLAGLVSVYLMFATMFVDQGISTALIQKRELQPEHINSAFWFSLMCAASLSLFSILAAEQFSAYFSEPRFSGMLRVASVSLVINAASSVHNALCVRVLDFRRPVIRMFLANLAGGAVGVGMAFRGDGAWSLIGQQLTASGIGTVFMWATTTWRPSLTFSAAHLREMFAMSSSIFATTLLYFFSCRLDQLVIGRVYGIAALGEYVVGIKAPDMIRTAICQPIGAVSLSALSRFEGDKHRMCAAIYHGMELNAIVLFPVFVGLATVSPELVPLVFGAKWQFAANICALFSLYSLISALAVFYHPALVASGGPGPLVFLSLAHSVGVAVACLLGVQFSSSAVVAALCINGLLFYVPGFYSLKNRIGLNPWRYFRTCVMPAIASLMMAACVCFTKAFIPTKPPSLIALISEILVGMLVYVVFISILSPLAIKNLIQLFKNSVLKSKKIPSEGLSNDMSNVEEVRPSSGN